MPRSTSNSMGSIISRGARANFSALKPTERSQPRILGDRIADGPWTTLTRLAHASDLHITDTESPARLDFLVDTVDDPRREQSLPTLRPQQLTSTHAAAATLQTIGRMAKTSRLDGVVLTGDLIDNGQANELDRFVAMIEGGTIAPSARTGNIEGAQSERWLDSKVWRPADQTNFWTSQYGFPSDPHLLAAVSTPITSSGLQLPVLLAKGNHDALLCGFVSWTSALSRIAVGQVKARELPSALRSQILKKRFVIEPEIFFTGPGIPVTADDRRRPLAGDEFPLAFNTEPQRARGNDYLVQLSDRLTIVVLDTHDPDGHPGGVLSTDQAQWLEDTLTAIEGTGQHPVVIVASHHGPAQHHVTVPERDRLSGTEVAALLGRRNSVALWLTGHTHVGTTTYHRPHGHRGFWEVSAPSIVDWPNQFQTIEVRENSSGALAIVVEQHDYDATTPSDEADMTLDLAGLHRLLSANQAGFGAIFPGTDVPAARDCTLHLETGEARG